MRSSSEAVLEGIPEKGEDVEVAENVGNERDAGTAEYVGIDGAENVGNESGAGAEYVGIDGAVVVPPAIINLYINENNRTPFAENANGKALAP